MISELDDDIFDDLFHGCALAAFVEQSRLQQDWPDREQTRQRAIRLYEQALRAKNLHPAEEASMNPFDANAAGVIGSTLARNL